MEDNTEQMKEYLKLKKLEDENKIDDLIDEIYDSVLNEVQNSK
ncbi:unknown [Clostridium sp. CAG:921]|nr:unknown [Clostridium sp. CAG:921]